MLQLLFKTYQITLLALCFSASQFSLAQTCSLPSKPATDYDFKIETDFFGANPNAPTDYYKLAVNWSGDYCNKIQADIAAESNPTKVKKIEQDNHLQCFSENTFGWVLHGLWASSCDGKQLTHCTDLKEIKKHPRFCRGDLPLLAYAQIEPYLCISPSAALLQAEWEKHGACDFANAQDYFAQSKRLFEALRFPERNMSHAELEQWLKQNNPVLQDKHILFRESEIYICYNTNFELINCPQRD